MFRKKMMCLYLHNLSISLNNSFGDLNYFYNLDYLEEGNKYLCT